MSTLTFESPRMAATTTQQPFSDFLNNFKARLHHVFHERASLDALGMKRGLPPFVLREIMSANPFAAFIASQYGGRGGLPSESLAVLSAASYEALALSLIFGINYALFIQPVTKYARDLIKPGIFRRFLEDKAMGGLMITEPDYGSDALNMQTAYSEHEHHYHIQGTKHWGGLTGWADYWLVTARRQTEDRGLKRDIDFFVCDMNQVGSGIEVEAFYENLGLYMIPYGLNKIDVEVPKTHKLEPETTGIKMMLDLLHRSRVQFAGMGMGFLQRLLDEAVAHCRARAIGGKSLFSFDQVQRRLAQMQSHFTVCSALCLHASEVGSLDNDLSGSGLEANAIKSVITDFMQDASQSLLQLVGAKGYRLDHIAGRATVDSRPFQIFEGSNDILYVQIADAVVKLMKRMKVGTLAQFLRQHPLMSRASERFGDLFGFRIDETLSQRKQVDLGRVLGRLITFNMVLGLGERGFRPDLVASSLLVQQEEITNLLSTYQSANTATLIEDYQEQSDWMTFVAAPFKND
jgi:alkylation response protein AidB-like acyl-CoA dehydrogenase